METPRTQIVDRGLYSKSPAWPFESWWSTYLCGQVNLPLLGAACLTIAQESLLSAAEAQGILQWILYAAVRKYLS